MGSFKYELVIVAEGVGHEGEYLFTGDIVENGERIGQYETPDYGGLPEFSFVSDAKKNEFFEYAVNLYGKGIGTSYTDICGIELIENLFEEIR